MQNIIILVGPDVTGKTHIAHELSRRLSIPVYKASDEHSSFLGDQNRFLMNLRYADPARLDLIKQLDASVIFDRGYPCEYAYSRHFKRETDVRMLARLDAEYAALGAVIVHCTRKSFLGIEDDLDASLKADELVAISSYYDEFLSTSKCRVLKLFVDDENLKREVNEITGFIGPLKVSKAVRERWARIAPGPLPEASLHEQARLEFRAMTAEQRRQTFVDAGIYYPDGRLRPEYCDDEKEEDK